MPVAEVKMHSLFCVACLKVWFSTHRDEFCPFCGHDEVAETVDP